MGENLKDVLTRINAKRQQQSKPLVKKEENLPIPDDTDDFSDIEKEEEKPLIKKEEVREQITKEQQILMEIEMLQNNGRYRVELLHQLQEINKALVVIAGVLADLNK